jgi:hypothetical protein
MIASITDFLKLDYFSSNPCDRPIQQKKYRLVAFSFAMVAISFTKDISKNKSYTGQEFQ